MSYEANSSVESRISTAAAIDKDKNSEFAVKWAVDKLRLKDNRILLIHVKTQHCVDSREIPKQGREPTPAETQSLFLPFRGFCARKGIRVKEVVLQGQAHDVASALSEYINLSAITTVVLGASNRGAIASQDSWKSSISDLSSFDEGTSRETPKERPFGRTSSPQHSVTSNEFPQALPGGSSTNMSYESMVVGSNYSGEGYSGHMTPPRQQPRVQPMNNLSLHVQMKESSPYSTMSGSSDHSEMRSFLSDVSFESLDQHQFSYASRSSTSSQTALSWQTRFRIAAEIATALNFLHRTRPEPLVHRDLKPANILLDRNYVSKISDVGLSRLVPPSIADNITQYCMTAAAGTFCYIDPEYQQTGMLGTKSDIYSLGVVLLQIITAKPAMGLTHLVETAIENDKFAEVLDPVVKDWPVEAALSMAKLSLKCCELRRRDRPDLDSEILPELPD